MQSKDASPENNPLAGLISDQEFALLDARDLLNERAIRDYRMRRTFRALREANIPAAEAIERLRQEYPYLQFDTIRKIVYNAGSGSTRTD